MAREILFLGNTYPRAILHRPYIAIITSLFNLYSFFIPGHKHIQSSFPAPSTRHSNDTSDNTHIVHSDVEIQTSCVRTSHFNRRRDIMIYKSF